MNFKTSKGPLHYAFTSGKGSPKYGKDFNSTDPLDFEFKATRMPISAAEAKEVQAIINKFWKDNKPEKIAKPSGTFLKPILANTDEKDEYGEFIKKETGEYLIFASTNAAFKQSVKGEETIKVTKVLHLRGNGEELPDSHPLVKGDVGIGEGSEGIIHGNIAITEYEGKAYVKFYLKAVQFSKFVPYEGSHVDAEDISGEEDDGLGGDGLDVAPISGPDL